MPPPPADEFADSDVPPPAEEEESEDVPPPPSDEEYAEEEEEKAPEPVKVTSSKSGKLSKYRVSNGDSLWRISGKSKIYADSFKWPLIYKANKALIEDPDLIYPRQNFEINQNYSDDVIDDAVSKAKETPRYEPHTEPRKKLPIKY
ncbi:MAG: LysM peptidoglycan-binding domain-containing protein [Candidatus Goldbacteria bacterium]|nr:LysM peptidoglycan-binding domain-containing protein [Candidatus Goldiibacteriota bacterium]